MNKKEKKERELLFKSYKKERIEKNTIKSETPDFIITDSVNNKQIGIEITTIYTTQASATLKNSDDSFNDKFIDLNKPSANKKVKKNKLLKGLNVTKVIGGENIVHKGHVIWHISKLTDFFSFFENIINKKSKSYINKKNGLQFVNLVAKDEENIFKPNKQKVGELYGFIRQEKLFKTIISSNFQEIFFISEFNSGTYNIPLKWMIFRSEYEIFKKFWFDFNKITQTQKDDQIMMLNNFCICLIHLGYENIYYSADKDFRYIFFGTSYWKIDLKTKDIDEKEFLALDLTEDCNAKIRFKNYNNYINLYVEYLNFRKDVCISLNEGHFRKLSD